MNNLSSYCGLVDAKIRASDKDLPELILYRSFSEWKPFSENHQEDSEKVLMQIKNYQPNHGGVQINIENLHVNDLNIVDTAAGISQKNPDQSEFGPKNEDIAFVMQDEEGVENPLMQIIRQYFGKSRTNSKKMRNSPMMIKLLKKEL